MAKDYYATLGVSTSASQDEIKAAFRKLAHEHHPDKGGKEEKFKEINEAYQVLGDKEKRAQYDRFGSDAMNGAQGFPGGFGGFSGGAGFDSSMFGDLGDILGGMFGGGGARQRKGDDIAVDVELTFKESIFGVEKEITLTKENRCERCGGAKAEPGTRLKECRACKGKGTVVGTQRTILGTVQVRTMCSACDGTGEIPETPCATCHGKGTTHGRKTLRVDVPSGVEDGMNVRVRGEGEAQGAGEESGDLYLRIRVAADKRFARKGTTLYAEKKIGFTQAALGDEVDVETVDGPVTMKIPAGTQSGDELRLRGKGVPSGRGRGDMIVVVSVVTPTKLDRKSREALGELNLRE